MREKKLGRVRAHRERERESVCVFVCVRKREMSMKEISPKEKWELNYHCGFIFFFSSQKNKIYLLFYFLSFVFFFLSFVGLLGVRNVW